MHNCIQVCLCLRALLHTPQEWKTKAKVSAVLKNRLAVPDHIGIWFLSLYSCSQCQQGKRALQASCCVQRLSLGLFQTTTHTVFQQREADQKGTQLHTCTHLPACHGRKPGAHSSSESRNACASAAGPSARQAGRPLSSSCHRSGSCWARAPAGRGECDSALRSP